jgi:hypothetical protein
VTAATDPQQYQRAVKALPFTVEYVFGEDGDTPADAEPDYTVVNAEGASVTSGTASLTTSGPQIASFTLIPDELPAVDLLTVTWSYTTDSVPVEVTSLVDVVGRRLFPLSDYGQFAELNGQSVTALELQRLAAEDFLERECGTAFATRYGSEQIILGGRRRFSGWGNPGGYGPAFRTGGYGRLALREPNVTLVRSITRTWVDSQGAAHTYSVNLDFVELDTFASVLEYRSDRATGEFDGLWGNLTIAYEYGRWLADVRRVALILARYRLLNGPLDSRASQLAVEGGGTINLLTPSIGGSVTGIAEVDSFIQRYNAHATSFVSGM